jgi:putative membrane protein insertion efficiency factor
MRKLVILFIRAYQYLISPLSPPTCRFTPSCSHYTIEAIEKHGVVKGGWLGLKRLLRCNPWNSGGYDPVP